MTSSAFAELKENADINVYVCRNRWFEAVYGGCHIKVILHNTNARKPHGAIAVMRPLPKGERANH